MRGPWFRRAILALAASVLAVGCATALAAGTVAAAGNEAPLADAGLDQTVPVGATVYLDAGGSTDPDGTVVAYRWNVTAPDGSTVPPDCPTCAQTSFTATQVGQYEATVTITDEANATATDTLLVTVTDVDGPSVEIDGPASPSPGSETDFTVRTEPGDASLSDLGWYVDGEYDHAIDLADDQRSVTISETFPETGIYTVRAEVRDADGYTNESTLSVRVADSGGATPYYCGQADLYGSDELNPRQQCSEIFEYDLHRTTYGEETWVDINGDMEITVPGDVIDESSEESRDDFGERERNRETSNSDSQSDDTDQKGGSQSRANIGYISGQSPTMY